MFHFSKASVGLVLSAVACLSLSCKKREFNQSETLHTLREPIHSANPAQWSAPDRSAYRKAYGKDDSDFLKDSDPIVQRLQFWVDKIDAWARSVSKIDMSGVPKPRVQVMLDKDVNAFVGSWLKCYTVPSVVNGGSGKSLTTIFIPSYLKGTLSDAPCLNVGGSEEEAKQYFDLLLTQQDEESRKECNMRLQDGKLYIDGPCFASSGTAIGFTAFTTANFVTVHSALIKQFSEAETISVVAHELGHYYRSHITSLKNRVDYFYENGVDNPSSRPAPTKNPELVALGKELQNLSSIPFLKGSPSLHYNRDALSVLLLKPESPDPLGDMFGFNKNIAEMFESKCGGNQECKTQCHSAAQAASAMELQRLLKRMEPPKTDQEKEVYSAAESKLAACAPKVKLTNSKKDQEIILNRLTDDFKELIRKVSHPPFANAGEALEFASREAGKFHDNWIAKLREAENKRLGYYTSEQEADEFNVEALAALNFPLQSAIDVELKLAQLDKNPREDRLTAEECKQALANNWHDKNGNPMMIPIGKWYDNHHSGCYRAFNISREIKTHKFSVDLKKRATPPGPEWSKMVQGTGADSSANPNDIEWGEDADKAPGSGDIFNFKKFWCRNGIVRCI